MKGLAAMAKRAEMTGRLDAVKNRHRRPWQAYQVEALSTWPRAMPDEYKNAYNEGYDTALALNNMTEPK